jgi:hypothetical protein
VVTENPKFFIKNPPITAPGAVIINNTVGIKE